jgi:hypothetical protein
MIASAIKRNDRPDADADCLNLPNGEFEGAPLKSAVQRPK